MIEEALTLVAFGSFFIILLTIALMLFCKTIEKIVSINDYEKKTIEPYYSDIVDGPEHEVKTKKAKQNKIVVSPVIYIHDF